MLELMPYRACEPILKALTSVSDRRGCDNGVWDRVWRGGWVGCMCRLLWCLMLMTPLYAPFMFSGTQQACRMQNG
jgi:hypothetical protein